MEDGSADLNELFIRRAGREMRRGPISCFAAEAAPWVSNLAVNKRAVWLCNGRNNVNEWQMIPQAAPPVSCFCSFKNPARLPFVEMRATLNDEYNNI
jgi:hypothetical protein